jgi:hypothetical protein
MPRAVLAAVRPEPKDPRRQHIGELMSHWHASMNDPIYAVGSFYVSGVPYPEVEVTRRARNNLLGDLAKPCFQKPEDQSELRQIVAYLDGELDEKSELPATDLDLGFEDFVRGYLVAMLWSTNGDDDAEGMGAGEPLDDDHGIEDFAPEALASSREDCRKFYDANRADFMDPLEDAQCSAEEYAGHNFLLTRNGHGCGFWDGRYEKEAGERLSEAARKFGEVNAYVGDDGQIYV